MFLDVEFCVRSSQRVYPRIKTGKLMIWVGVDSAPPPLPPPPPECGAKSKSCWRRGLRRKFWDQKMFTICFEFKNKVIRSWPPSKSRVNSVPTIHIVHFEKTRCTLLRWGSSNFKDDNFCKLMPTIVLKNLAAEGLSNFKFSLSAPSCSWLYESKLYKC